MEYYDFEDGKKLLWLHCPKTAGNTQGNFLTKNFKESQNRHLKARVVHGIRSNNRGIVHPDHETLMTNITYGGDEVSEYRPLVAMRNPLDWHLSWYHFYAPRCFEENGNDLVGRSFVEYVRWIDSVKSGASRPLRVDGRYHCLMNQSEWSWDGKHNKVENILDTSRASKCFEKYFDINFGIPNLNLPIENVTKNKPNSHTSETTQIIEKWFKADFEIYELVKKYWDAVL
jgi:hypothetical protein